MEYKGIDNLEIYKISLGLSTYCWKLYKQRDFSIKKIIWDQYIRAIDSIGANISEWFGRFHYLDSVKFYYNARWSLFEAKYWVKLLYDREFITKENNNYLCKDLDVLWIKLNNFIKYIKKKKIQEQ
jgi:four helix bundle protein